MESLLSELLAETALGGRCIENIGLDMGKSTHAGGWRVSSDSEERGKGGLDVSAWEQAPSTEENLGSDSLSPRPGGSTCGA